MNDFEATGLDEIVRHVDYLADRMGIDHVAFGSDFDGASCPRRSAASRDCRSSSMRCASATTTDEVDEDHARELAAGARRHLALGSYVHAMRTRTLGPLEVSVVGLGCNNFGGRVDEAATRAVVDAALDAGVTFFDTADIYGGSGRSEEFLGRALEGRRDRVVLATKCGRPMGDGAERRGARDYIRARGRGVAAPAADRPHRPLPASRAGSEHAARGDARGARGARREGKVREIGTLELLAPRRSTSADRARASATRTCRSRASTRCSGATPRRSVLPTCARLGLGVHPVLPARERAADRQGHRASAAGRRAPGSHGREIVGRATLDRVEALHAWAEAHGHTLLELAFGWLRPARVAWVIAGATKPEQVRANARSWSPAELAELDAL